MPHTLKRTSKVLWSQDQVKAAMSAVKHGRKIREFGLQFVILEATLTKQLKLNRPAVQK
jgi:hypothetical protein